MDDVHLTFVYMYGVCICSILRRVYHMYEYKRLRKGECMCVYCIVYKSYNTGKMDESCFEVLENNIFYY